MYDIRQLTVHHHGPNLAETLAVGVRVSCDSVVVLEELDDIIDVAVDGILVGARGEDTRVVNTSELSRRQLLIHMT